MLLLSDRSGYHLYEKNLRASNLVVWEWKGPILESKKEEYKLVLEWIRKEDYKDPYLDTDTELKLLDVHPLLKVAEIWPYGHIEEGLWVGEEEKDYKVRRRAVRGYSLTDARIRESFRRNYERYDDGSGHTSIYADAVYGVDVDFQGRRNPELFKREALITHSLRMMYNKIVRGGVLQKYIQLCMES